MNFQLVDLYDGFERVTLKARRLLLALGQDSRSL